MNNPLDSISPIELGERLRIIRKRLALTQDEVCQEIGLSRPTLISIEKGERQIKPNELVSICKLYKYQVSEILRFKSTPEISVQFRGPASISQEDNDEIEPFIHRLKILALKYTELEELTNSHLAYRYPTEYIVGNMKVAQAAEYIALQERQRLGLGDSPIGNLRSLLEYEVGIRIFNYPMPSKFSAIYMYSSKTGACIAVNSGHPNERQRYSLAHDYLHFLCHRINPDISFDDRFYKTRKSERLGDAFPIYFLAPTNSLIRKFNDISHGKNFTPSDIVSLASYYGVSSEALTLRLEDLSLLPTGTWDRVRNSNLKITELKQNLNLSPPIDNDDKLFPIRYYTLAISAFSEGKITESEMANFLEQDHMESRKTLKKYSSM